MQAINLIAIMCAVRDLVSSKPDAAIIDMLRGEEYRRRAWLVCPFFAKLYLYLCSWIAGVRDNHSLSLRIADATTVVWFARACILLADAIVLGVTWRRTFMLWREAGRLGVPGVAQ